MDQHFPIPEMCQAAVFHGANSGLRLERLPVPVPGADEALVQIECSTICGSDLHTITGARREAVPSVLGHEALGKIAAVGNPAPCDLQGVALKPGDRVTWSTSVSCSTCDRCLSGLPQKCRSLAKYGHEKCVGRAALSGGLAEFLLLRTGSAIVKLDAASPAEIMCPANCATATVAAAFRVSGEAAGRRVLILGAGMLGLTAAAFARTADAARVTVSDPNTVRLPRAIEFGADEVWESVPEDIRQPRFDLVLEMSGSPAAVEAACQLADVGGTVILVGTVLGTRPAQLDPESIVRRWLTIRGVHNYTPEDLRVAVAFLTDVGPRYPFHGLVERTCRLCEIQDAIATAVRDRPVRLMVTANQKVESRD